LICFVVSTFLLLFLGFPISLAFLGGSLLYFWIEGLGIHLMMNIMIRSTQNFILLAIPFFILAAHIMELGKITDVLFDFAHKLVGHIRGGLSHVNILTSVIFAGMSGTALADTSGIGYMCADSMIKKGFSKPFSASLTIATSTIGPIIPPSITMVLYAGLSGASIGKLFLGGIIPGIIMGLGFMVYCYLIDDKRNFPKSERPTFKEIFLSFKSAFFPLMTPVILLGGIYSGVFTPTEAAIVTTLWALIVGYFLGGLTLKSLAQTSIKVISFTGIVTFIIATAALFSFIVSREQIPQLLTSWITDLELSEPILLLVTNIVFLILGALFDTNTIILVFVPMILPALQRAGIDLVHFGVIVTLNATIGLLTPPFGMNLFVISGLTKIPVSEILKELWPMLLILISVLFLITYVDSLVMWLPSFL
jgi:tripartite ATP-independent transporter DctM subunit